VLNCASRVLATREARHLPERVAVTVPGFSQKKSPDSQ